MKSLYDFAEWDIKTIQSFDRLVTTYNAIPNSKNLLSSLLRFEELYQPIGHFRTDPLGYLRGENEYREIKRARIYLANKDLIKITNSKGEKKLVLTSQGHRIFYKDYPLAELRDKKWDGHWTIVTYDFPEKLRDKRNKFRKKLMDLGFGTPHESLLVTPLKIADEISEVIESLEVKDLVWVTSASRILGMDNCEVARAAWDLDEINKLYLKLYDILPKLRKAKDKNLSKEWRQLFLAVDATDPYLPYELLPQDWYGERCRKEFKKTNIVAAIKSIIGSW